MVSFQRGVIEDWLFGKALILTSTAKELGFDAAVENLDGVEKHDFGPLPLNYGGLTMEFGGQQLFPTISSQSISELLPAESNENFWRAAFFTPLGQASEPLVVGDSVLVIYPREETTEEEAEGTEGIDAFYSTWASNNAETSLRSHFLQSKKLDDKFYATYLQYLYQPSE